MLISEAVSFALVKSMWISRASQPWMRVFPTDTSSCCIVCRVDRDGTPAAQHVRWNPQAADLLADDWILVAKD